MLFFCIIDTNTCLGRVEIDGVLTGDFLSEVVWAKARTVKIVRRAKHQIMERRVRIGGVGHN